MNDSLPDTIPSLFHENACVRHVMYISPSGPMPMIFCTSDPIFTAKRTLLGGYSVHVSVTCLPPQKVTRRRTVPFTSPNTRHVVMTGHEFAWMADLAT